MYGRKPHFNSAEEIPADLEVCAVILIIQTRASGTLAGQSADLGGVPAGFAGTSEVLEPRINSELTDPKKYPTN